MEQSILLPEDFPVNRTLPQEKNLPQKIAGIYGLNVGEHYAKYIQSMQSLKMYKDYQRRKKVNSSRKYYVTFTKAGMMQNGILWELEMPEHPIEEIASSLYAIQPFPTPCAFDATYNVSPTKWKKRRARMKKKYGHHISSLLRLYTAVLMYSLFNKKQKAIKGAKLTPEFIEWMMGYPKNWTDPSKKIKDHNNWKEEWKNVSRIARTANEKDRVLRIKALGNSVVPQVVIDIMKRLKY